MDAIKDIVLRKNTGQTDRQAATGCSKERSVYLPANLLNRKSSVQNLRSFLYAEVIHTARENYTWATYETHAGAAAARLSRGGEPGKNKEVRGLLRTFPGLGSSPTRKDIPQPARAPQAVISQRPDSGLDGGMHYSMCWKGK